MKKTILIAVASIIMFSCGETQKTQEEINTEYVQKAQKYIDVKLAEESEDKNKPKSFKIIKVDSISDVSSSDVEYLKMIDFQREITREFEYQNKLVEIDQTFGDEISTGTNNQIEKCNLLKDSLDRWIASAEKMNKKDKIAKQVRFICDIELMDGSKNKGVKFAVYFDEEGDIDAKIMSNILK